MSTVICPGHTTTAVDKDTSGRPLWDSTICRPPDGKPVCPYSVTFSNPGTFKYYCVIHGGSSPNNPITHMDGQIVVQPTAVVSETPWIPLFVIFGGVLLALSRRRRVTSGTAA